MRTLSALFIVIATAIYAQSYAIKGPAAPKPYEANAVKELGDYLAKRIDGSLTVGGHSPVVFHVGDTEFAKAHKCFSSDLKDEQWIIKSVGSDIILNGGGTRGALYAVYHFLEDYCDIHWWSEYEEYVPKPSSISLPALDAKGKPAFLYRDIYCYHETDNNHPGYVPFAIRNRLNRAGDRPVPIEFGGSINYGPPYHCHTQELYISPKDYFKEHPEYFSLIKGKRVAERSQCCLTNPDVKRIFTEKLLAYIKQGDAEAAKRNVAPPRIYDISMNDWAGFCECDKCKAEIDKYGYSGYMLRFVNMLADKVAETRPELYVSTLAYFQCDTPPKGGVRASDNVIVKLCDTDTNQAASILEEDNRKFREKVREWSKFAKNLFIWDYAITFVYRNTDLPFASEFYYGDLYRHYLDCNVKGVFWEHERIDRADSYELKFFMETKLLEDPNQDVDKLISLFMSRFYGAAAPYILKYRREIDKVRKENNGFVAVQSIDNRFSYIKNEMLPVFQNQFDEAEAAVKDDATLLHHVRKARMGLDNLTARRFVPVLSHGYDFKDTAPKGLRDAAAARYLKTFDEWVSRFPEKNALKARIRGWLPFDVKLEEAPVPKELEGRKFFDCHPGHFSNEAAWGIDVVADSESPVGNAMRIYVARSRNDNMPFPVGVYDEGNEKTLANVVTKTIPEGNGYHWFKVPPVTMPEIGYVYASGSWTIQMPLPHPYIRGKKFEVWVSAKHVGEQFHAGQGKPEYTYVDRILFIEAEDGK